ncbi:MAG TPA: hypothetical protein VGG39_24945 [Polyangiaceae bacterium]|jgi:hypothetical protein
MSAFTWDQSGNYPAGSQPWSGTPKRVPPAQTYLTPQLKPPAQNLNDMFATIAANIATLDANQPYLTLFNVYSGEVGTLIAPETAPWYTGAVPASFTQIASSTLALSAMSIGGPTPTVQAGDVLEVTATGSLDVSSDAITTETGLCGVAVELYQGGTGELGTLQDFGAARVGGVSYDVSGAFAMTTLFTAFSAFTLPSSSLSVGLASMLRKAAVGTLTLNLWGLLQYTIKHYRPLVSL